MYVLVFIVPHVDIELEDNKQFISNIPRITDGSIGDKLYNNYPYGPMRDFRLKFSVNVVAFSSIQLKYPFYTILFCPKRLPDQY